MKNKLEHIGTLTEIKKIMDRSSKFISLSGFAGVYIGIIAIIGVFLFCFFFKMPIFRNNFAEVFSNTNIINQSAFSFIIADAIIMLLTSISIGILFTSRKAHKLQLPVWNKQALYLVVNLAIPLVTGGIFCIVLFKSQVFSLIVPSTLIFYGLALVNASKFTFNDLKYLGIIDVLLGLFSCFYTQFALLNWSIGFGLLHIIYGIVMFYKYEREVQSSVSSNLE